MPLRRLRRYMKGTVSGGIGPRSRPTRYGAWTESGPVRSGSSLRPGDTNTASGAVAFVIQSVARLPHARRCTVILRADRGFDITALYAECERRGWHYVVKLRVMADIAARIWAQATAGRWRRIHDDGDMPIEVSEVRVHRKCWGQARRVVLQRRRDPENPQGHHTRTSEDAV